MGEFVSVASVEDLTEGEPAKVVLEDHELELVLIRRDGEVHALEDRCSHEDFPLSEGEVLNGQIECALHGARFEIASGDAKALPAVKPVKRFECRVEDGDVQVELD